MSRLTYLLTVLLRLLLLLFRSHGSTTGTVAKYKACRYRSKQTKVALRACSRRPESMISLSYTRTRTTKCASGCLRRSCPSTTTTTDHTRAPWTSGTTTDQRRRLSTASCTVSQSAVFVNTSVTVDKKLIRR